MSHKHAKILREIFHDPVSANIHWRDIESLLNHLDAEVLNTHGATVHYKLNGREGIVHRPHHGGTCTKQDIRHLREFLASARVTPAQYEND